MIEGLFKYENDLLKHHVRTEGWLPICKKRLKSIRDANPPKKSRPLRYFTFCAVGAVDVLMLDVAKIIRPSKNGRFDTVFFFDKTPELVNETQKRIPGAIGFPGNFTDIVLLDDPNEDYVLDGLDYLASPELQADEFQTRERQLRLATRQSFISCFPFDVINLDLEEFLFKPNDQLPGKVINALRKVFAWQRRPLAINKNKGLEGFSLMFTTQVGPPNLSENYLKMLRDRLNANLIGDDALKILFTNRTGCNDTTVLQNEKFETFFKLAVPKIFAAILKEEDWHIDPNLGILVFEFERSSKSGPYKMLHLVMDVKRHNPPKEKRAPGDVPADAQEAYRKVVHQIFTKTEVVVSEKTIDKTELHDDLKKIKARRRKYYPDDALDDQSARKA